MDAKKKGDIGEQAVNEIAYKTYLKYWCYPNPKDEHGDKKEICDLLILFSSTAIIISVKNYSFKGDYDKYFRQTLDKAILQIQGAERKLFNSISDVYIKHPDMDEIKFEPHKFNRIHRVIVNLNTVPLFYPFGRKSKYGYTHIFNWDAFLRTVIELDTIPDFIQYLKVREETFADIQAVFLTGKEEDWDPSTSSEFLKNIEAINLEEDKVIWLLGNELDLLADYYFNERKFHTKFSDDYSVMNFDMDGKWNDYLSRKEVQRKKREDRISYFIDEFVKREVLYRNHPNNIEIATELLSFSRFERRVLGKMFFDLVDRYKNEEDNFIARRYGNVGEVTVCYLLYGPKVEDFMLAQLIDLAAMGYCYWDKYRTKKIVIITASKDLTRFKYGFLKDIQPLSKQEEASLVNDLKLLTWFQNLESIAKTIKEYPDQES